MDRMAWLKEKFSDPGVHTVRIPVIEPIEYRTMWADHVKVIPGREYPRDIRSVGQGAPRHKVIEVTREQFEQRAKSKSRSTR